MSAQSGIHPIDPRELQHILSAHLPMYRKKVPFYQATMLDNLRSVWTGHHRRLLDVGGGTGVIAEAIARLFPVEEVHAVDLVDRFCPSLSISTAKYDGKNLPFGDRSFDAGMLNNVLHHVPVEARPDLLREIRRVVKGPLYIKDHESRGIADNLRLTLMDAIGNIPFGGMLWARYLTNREWERLATDTGYRIAAKAAAGRYRNPLYAALFPNRLEVTMRFEPV